MLATAIIVFREAIEAGLIIGIVLAASRGVVGRGRAVGLGVLCGCVGSLGVAAFAGSIAEAFDGAGQELLNAAILVLAVGMLAWHVIWMSSHGREMAADMRAVGSDVVGGRRPVSALGIVVGVAVLREGAEVVLFLSGIAVAGNAPGSGGSGDGPASMLFGGGLGLALAAAITALTYAGLVRIPPGRLFAVTGWMVTLLAAGLAAQAAGLLQQAGTIDAFVTPLWATPLWDSAALLPVGSIGGRVLHTLIGYTDRPTGLQLLAYLGTLASIVVLARLQPKPAPRKAMA